MFFEGQTFSSPPEFMFKNAVPLVKENNRPSTVQTAEWRVERRRECSRIKRSKEVLGEPCYPDFKYIS